MHFYKSAQLGYGPAVKYCEDLDKSAYQKLLKIKSTENSASTLQSSASTVECYLDVPSLGPTLLLDPNKVPLQSFQKTMEPLHFIDDLQHHISRAENFATKYCQEHSRDLSFDSVAALHMYTLESQPRETSLYFRMNSVLQSQDREAAEAFMPFIKLLMHSLILLPPFIGTVWRAINLDVTTEYIKNQEVVFSAFTSCATDLSAIGNFFDGKKARTLINIQGSHGHDIRNYSAFSKESEILFFPNSRFKVVDVLKAGELLYIVQLVELV